MTGVQTCALPISDLRARDEQISYRYGVHNTTTYLVPLYLDFGALGLIVMPGLFGVATAFVYRRFRERLSIFWLIVYIDFFLAVVLAFRTQKFFANTLIYFAGVALLAQLVAVLAQVTAGTLAPEAADLPFFGLATSKVAGVPVVVSRTGFTG